MSDDEEQGSSEEIGQDAIDDIFGDDSSGSDAGGSAAPAPSKSMNLDEIEQHADLNTDDRHKYAVGEAMVDDVTAIYDVPVQISAVLGRSTMQVSQLLKLGRGAVVELDRKVGEAIDIYVNNRLVARGEVVVVEDKLGVTMTEIVKSERS